MREYASTILSGNFNLFRQEGVVGRRIADGNKSGCSKRHEGNMILKRMKTW